MTTFSGKSSNNKYQVNDSIYKVQVRLIKGGFYTKGPLTHKP